MTRDGSDCTCESSDGCFGPIIADGKINRTFISINRGFPGPTLIVHEGQTVVVNVENRFHSNISFHWHGMHQRKTNWMDGVESLTQFGIYPGKKFRYIFNPSPTGTFWYHSHSESQRVNGLFGGLVILENNIDSVYGDFIDLPEMHTLTLLDWNVVENEDAIVTYAPDGAEVGTDPFASGLINGKGKHPDITISELATFNVSASQRYRFRLIGVQNYYGFRFSIDGHKLKLISTDGSFVRSVDADYIILHAGERYDFILETKSATEIANQREFMIRAETLEVVVDDNNGSFLPNVSDPSHTYNLLLQHSAEAILRYDTSSSIAVSTIQPSIAVNANTNIGSTPIQCGSSSSSQCLAINCPFEKFPDSYNIDCLHIHKLVALPSASEKYELPLASPDKTLFLNFAFEGPKGDDSINGRSMSPPSFPPSLVLPRDQSGIRKCTNLEDSRQCDDFTTEENCRCPHIIEVGRDESVQMVFSMVRVKRTITEKEEPTRFFAHPVHLHGHYFRVVDIQFGEYHDGSSRLTKTSSEPACTGSKVACTNPEWNNKTSSIATGRKYASSDGSLLSSYPLKDSILIPAGGYAVVYLKANNPGMWFLHCHIADHQVTGMALALSEDLSNVEIPPLGLRNAGENFNWTLDQFNYLFDDDSAGNVVVPNTMLLIISAFCLSVFIAFY